MSSEHPEKLDPNTFQMDFLDVLMAAGMIKGMPESHPKDNVLDESHIQILDSIAATLNKLLNRAGLKTEPSSYHPLLAGSQVVNTLDIRVFSIVDSLKTLTEHLGIQESVYFSDERSLKITADSFMTHGYRFGDPDLVATSEVLLEEISWELDLVAEALSIDIGPHLETEKLSVTEILSRIHSQINILLGPQSNTNPSFSGTTPSQGVSTSKHRESIKPNSSLGGPDTPRKSRGI